MGSSNYSPADYSSLKKSSVQRGETVPRLAKGEGLFWTAVLGQTPAFPSSSPLARESFLLSAFADKKLRLEMVGEL